MLIVGGGVDFLAHHMINQYQCVLRPRITERVAEEIKKIQLTRLSGRFRNAVTTTSRVSLTLSSPK
jgi:hypothetical protein